MKAYSLCAALTFSQLFTLNTASHHHFVSQRDENAAELALEKPFLAYILAKPQLPVLHTSLPPVIQLPTITKTKEAKEFTVNETVLAQKHLLVVCNNCLQNPNMDLIGLSEKRSNVPFTNVLSATKRDHKAAVTKVTKICCLQACTDDQ
uniref:Secreted protein n=1 Tax=Ditylenchus dipsaci TaxID=166011 RepID=A0A915D568_9BILA